jgi:hypothetical protein
MRKTRFEIEQESLSKALNRRSSQLAKLASPEGMESLKKYAEGCASHILAEWNAALRKGASTADRDAIFKAAAASYRAVTPSLLAEIENEIGMLTESVEKMRKALPAFKRQVLHGIDDPDGVDVKPPGYDPGAPIVDHGRVLLAEKRYTLFYGERGEQIFSKFVMPQQQQPQVDPAKNVGAVAMLRNSARGED